MFDARGARRGGTFGPLPRATPARKDAAAGASGIPVRLLWLLLAATFPLSAWSAGGNQDIVVRADKAGPKISVYVDCPVDAPVMQAWGVLTDYDRMAQFVSNLELSVVEHREANLLRVRQKGKVTRGPLTFNFENIREIELIAYREIHSRMISGDLIPAEFATRLEQIDGVLHIINTGSYTPKIWVPPGIGTALIEAETRKQYGEIRAEILRRGH
jgi:hypothetical protein